MLLQVRFSTSVSLPESGPLSTTQKRIFGLIKSKLDGTDYPVSISSETGQISVSQTVMITVSEEEDGGEEGTAGKEVICSWEDRDEELGTKLHGIVQSLSKNE